MKVKTTYAGMLCALSLLAVQPVWAAKKGPSAEISVAGNITPGSCKVNLGGEGKFDYGNILADKISDDEKGTPLDASAIVSLAISCDSPTQVGINLVDMRFESLVWGLTLLNPAENGKAYRSNPQMFGLGTNGDKKIGAYIVGIKNAGLDGYPAHFLDVDATTLKTLNDGYDKGYLGNDSLSKANLLTTWTPGLDKPATGTLFTADLQMGATVNKRSALDLNGGVKLDGKATLTVYYL